MSDQVLNIIDEGAIRILELNRPEKRNALNDAVIAGIKDGLQNASF